MSDVAPKYWFPAKRYGWGWGLPCAWQGWVVFVLWLALSVTIGSLTAVFSMPLFFIFIAGMSAAIIAICYWKGEPPRWRWGE